jgi:hypothetical protein
LSVANETKFGGDVRITQGKKLYFRDNGNGPSMEYDGTNLVARLNDSTKKISIGATGHLHGTWQVDSSAVTSDRRLKDGVRPLFYHLSDVRRMQKRNVGLLPEDKGYVREGQLPPSEVVSDKTMIDHQKEEAIEVLAQLRPVSYYLKNNLEAKRLSFGFIAQEVEELLPNLVFNTGTRLALNYNDIIAVVVMAVQQQVSSLKAMRHSVEAHDAKLKEHSVQIFDLQQSGSFYSLRLAALEEEVLHLKNKYLRLAQEVGDVGNHILSVPDEFPEAAREHRAGNFPSGDGRNVNQAGEQRVQRDSDGSPSSDVGSLDAVFA